MHIKLAKIKKKIIYLLGEVSVKQLLQVGIETRTSYPSPWHFKIMHQNL